jgi:hypothetical protein
MAAASGGVSLELFCELFFTVKQSHALAAPITQSSLCIHCCVSLTEGGMEVKNSLEIGNHITSLKDDTQLHVVPKLSSV